MKFILSIILIFMSGPVKANPNHLVPVPAYESDGYSLAVIESLIGTLAPELWMIVRPSFQKEYAIILYRDREYENPPVDATGKIRPSKSVKENLYLSQVAAKNQIQAWKDIGDGKSTLDIKPTDQVLRDPILIDGDDYKDIVKAWTVALKTTRYPDSANLGRDGTTYQFYSRYQLFGQTWSPTKGLPRMLVDLGHKLEEIIETKKGDRNKILIEANRIANKIINWQP